MFDLLRKTFLGAVAALALVIPGGAAYAATVTLSNGDVINPLDVGDEYLFETLLSGPGGPGSVSFTFTALAADAPLPVLASTANVIGGTLTGAYMTWFDGVNTYSGTLTSFGSPVFAIIGQASTLFTDPSALTQVLTFGWTGRSGSSQVSVRVSAVPLPAGGLLLIGALGGLAALRRRKMAA